MCICGWRGGSGSESCQNTVESFCGDREERHYTWIQVCRMKKERKREMILFSPVRLKSTALTSTPSTLLHHFVYSVFIHTHLTSPPLPSSPHHRPHNKEPRPCQAQLHRLDLCRRLLVALEVCGHIQEPSLCLQTVVMVHRLLSPLLQRDIATLDIARVCCR